MLAYVFLYACTTNPYLIYGSVSSQSTPPKLIYLISITSMLLSQARTQGGFSGVQLNPPFKLMTFIVCIIMVASASHNYCHVKMHTKHFTYNTVTKSQNCQ